MNKKEMKQLILESVARKLGGGYSLSIQEVLKTNVKLDGLTILRKGENIAPTIYLEPYYKVLKDSTALDAVTDAILHDYSHAAPPLGNFNAASFSDSEWAKDRLRVRLINRHLNTELLKDVPYSPFLDDFAVTVCCLVGKPEEKKASFLVHNSYLEIWDLDRESLLSTALSNTLRKSDIRLIPMHNIIRETLPQVLSENPQNYMWVLTNSQKLYGAAAVLSDDTLKAFAEEHGSFYVIFSSVHEVLLVPTPDDSNISAITEINQQVNATHVQADEILGTRAYFYSKDNGFALQAGGSPEKDS